MKYISFIRQSRKNPENIDTFHTRLRKLLSGNCDFRDKDKEIKSQIIQGCCSTRLPTKESPTTRYVSDKLIKEARALERSDKHASEIENSSHKETSAKRHKHK